MIFSILNSNGRVLAIAGMKQAVNWNRQGRLRR
jgi:hypothetical protein